MSGGGLSGIGTAAAVAAHGQLFICRASRRPLGGDARERSDAPMLATVSIRGRPFLVEQTTILRTGGREKQKETKKKKQVRDAQPRVPFGVPILAGSGGEWIAAIRVSLTLKGTEAGGFS